VSSGEGSGLTGRRTFPSIFLKRAFLKGYALLYSLLHEGVYSVREATPANNGEVTILHRLLLPGIGFIKSLRREHQSIRNV